MSAIDLASLYLEVESSHQKFFLETKILRKFRYLGYFSTAKTEGYDEKDWSVCKRFGIIITCSAAYFLEAVARISLKEATKDFWKVKTLSKLRSLAYFSKAKTEECHQEDWSVSDKFWIITPATCHLEVGASFSLKATTKASLRGKKLLKHRFSNYFSKAKAVECD